MNKAQKIKIAASIYAIMVFPEISFAANDFIGLLDTASAIITNILIPLAFALCLFYFFWGMAKYIKQGAVSDKAAQEGKRVMTWGIVALFVVSCVWGIVKFIQSELQIPNIENTGISQNLLINYQQT